MNNCRKIILRIYEQGIIWQILFHILRYIMYLATEDRIMTNIAFSKIGVISGQKHDAKQFKAECVNHTLLHRVHMNENILDNVKIMRFFSYDKPSYNQNLNIEKLLKLYIMNVMFMLTQKKKTEPFNQSS